MQCSHHVRHRVSNTVHVGTDMHQLHHCQGSNTVNIDLAALRCRQTHLQVARLEASGTTSTQTSMKSHTLTQNL